MARTSARPTRRRRVGRWLRRLVLYPLLALGLLLGGTTAWVQATMFRGGDPMTRPLVLTGVTALVGPQLEPLEEATVVVRDGRIAQVGAGADVVVPQDAEVLALPGHTVLPGLIDSHVHLAAPSSAGVGAVVTSVVEWFRYAGPRREAYLEHGITSIRSMGDEPEWILGLRRKVADGELAGPRVFAAGPVFTTLGGHPVVTLHGSTDDPGVRVPSTPEEARAMVRALTSADDADGPVDLVKVIHDRGDPAHMALDPIPVQVLRAVVEEAHVQGIPVVAHWGTLEDLAELLDAGVDGLDHLEPRGVGDGWDQALLSRAVADGVTLAPTFAVVEPVLDDTMLATLQGRLAEYVEAGGRVVAGSDAPMNGVEFGAGLVRELELLVDAGLSPQQTLVAATSTAAEVIRTEDAGVLQEGRPADLLVVRGDPLGDIGVLGDVMLVVRDGTPVVDNLP